MRLRCESVNLRSNSLQVLLESLLPLNVFILEIDPGRYP